MAKVTIQNYIFNKTAKTVTILDYISISKEGLLLITNTTTGTLIYQFNDSTLGGTITGNVITLSYDTSAMSNTDKLQIIYEDQQPFQSVGNSRKKFRDGFSKPFATAGIPDPATWTLANTDGHLITQGGNSSGSSYAAIHLNPLQDDTEVTMTSLDTFTMPSRVGFGISISQRISGQEVFAGLIGDDGTGIPDLRTAPLADRQPTASFVATTSLLTVTMTAHGYTGGDRICIYGATDPRINVGPVTVTVLTADTFTVPGVFAAGTTAVGSAYVRYADPLRNAYNGAGYLWGDSTSVTTASLVSRRNGSRFRSLSSSVTTTTATQTNTNPYTDAFNSAGNFESELRLEEVNFRSYASDSLATASGPFKLTQSIPNEDISYHIHIRARNLIGMTKPIARITSIAKTGTTTATVTTDVAHGLSTSDFVQIYGVTNQAASAFPNLTAATAVTGTPTSTTFTVVIGTAATVSSAGGAVWRVQGSVLAPGVFNSAIQSITQTNGIITVIGSATWATPLPGEYVYLHGMDGAATYEGAYKVLRVSTTTLELQGNTGVADFTTITTGGAAIKMTTVRLHFARILDYSRLVAEISGGRGNSADINNSVPVSFTGGATMATSQSTGSASTQWNAAGYGGLMAIDVASAAITTTTTTTAITPGLIANIGVYSNSFNIVVTAATGTNPTMDVGIEESMDNGTNWIRIYDFPRITGTGAYTSPVLPSVYGTRFRYVQTIAGTTPSFTRAVNRVQFSYAPYIYRQFYDRSIVLTTLNSVTPTYTVEGTNNVQLAIKVGAITTTAPQIQLEGNDDGTSTGWYQMGSPVTAVASSAVIYNVVNMPTRYVRGRVSTAGVGVTADYVQIKAQGI